MKTKFLQRVLWLMIPLLTIFTTNAWGDTYTITFATNSGDGTKASTSTAASTCTTAATYVTGNLVTASNVYYGGSDGLKLGTKSGAGDIKINLSTSGQVVPTSVVVYAKYYSSSRIGTVQVVTNLGSNTATNTTNSFTAYTYSYSGSTKLSWVEIKSNKYIWVEKVVVTYTAAATFTMKVPVGDGTFTTLSNKSATDMTYATAQSGNECTYGFSSAYDSYWTSTYRAKADATTTKPSPTYADQSKGGATVPSGVTLYPIYVDGNKYHTDPRCEVYTFDLTYDANGGTGAPSNQTGNTSGSTVTVSSTEPTRSGYTFMGWSTSSTATTKDDNYDPGDSFTITADVALYAVWCKDLSKSSITVNEPTLTSYNSGTGKWTVNVTWTAVDGATYYTVQCGDRATSTVVLSETNVGNVTSYSISNLTNAHEHRIIVTAKHACDATQKQGKVDFTPTCDKDVSAVTPTVNATTSITKTGATANWTAVSDADHYTVKVYAGATATGSAVKTYTNVTGTSQAITGLTAGTQYCVTVQAHDACSHDSQIGTGGVFTTTALTLYHVDFVNQSGAAVATVTQTTEGGNVTLPSASPSAACAALGWSFAGWKDNSAQTETTSAPTLIAAGSYNPSGNKTFYAVYTMTESGGGTPKTTLLSSDFSSGNDDTNWPTQENITTETGSIRFSSKNGAGSIKSISLSASVGTTINVTMSIKDYGDTGTEAKVSITGCSEQSFATSSYEDFTEVTKSFVSTQANFQVTIAASGTKKRFYIENVEIYYGGGGSSTTYWNSNPSCSSEATVTYHNNGAKSGSAPTDANSPYTIGAQVTVLGTGTMVAPDGKEFKCWNTAADGTGTDYNTGAKFDIAGNMDFYPKWVNAPYTVYFNAEGGTCATSSLTEASGGAGVVLPAATATCSDWSFAGWKENSGQSETTSDISSSLYEAGTTYYPTSNITLHAVFATYGSGSNTTFAVVKQGMTAVQDGYYVISYNRAATLYSLGSSSYVINPSTGRSGVTIIEVPSTSMASEATLSSKDPVWQFINVSSNNFRIRNYKTGQYLKATDENNELLLSSTADDNYSLWTITCVTEDNNANTNKIQNVATSDYLIKYTSGDCYVSQGSTPQTLYFYRVTSAPIFGSATYNSNPSCPTHEVTIGSHTNGTIEVNGLTTSPQTVEDGNTVEITATPESGYNFTTWAITKTTGGNDVTSTLLGANATTASTSFTMPDYDVTVSATFTAKVMCTITWNVNGSTYTTGGPSDETESGTKWSALTLPTAPADNTLSACDRTKFVGWSTSQLFGDGNSAPSDLFKSTSDDNADSHTITGTTTFYAVFAKGSGDGWEKVSSTPDNWCGDYLLAYEASASSVFVWNGSTDASNYVEATPSDGLISKPTGGVEITIEHFGETANYAIKVKEGTNKDKYFKGNSSNGFTLEDTQQNTTIGSVEDIGFTFTNSSSYLRFNTTSGQTRFRYYKSSTAKQSSYKTIALYQQASNYSDYATQCCTLKPVTNLAVSSTTANSVTLTWTAPSPTTGIDHLELRNASTDVKIGSNIAVGTTTTSVSGLVECNTYSYKIVSVGAVCETPSDVVEATPFGGSKTVTFNYNGGSGSPTSFTTSCAGNTVALPTPDTRTGYTFLGWWSAQNGGTKKGDAGDIYTVSGNTTIWAHWAQNFTVTYDLNGGAADPICSGGTYYVGQSVTVCSTTPTKTSSSFLGWKRLDTDATVAGGSTFTMPSNNVTIQAQWETVYFHIYYKEEDGTAIATADVPQTAETTLRNQTPCVGYTFFGWSESKITTETTSKPAIIGKGGASYTPDADITVYPVYARVEGASDKNDVITKDINGGSGSYTAFSNVSYVSDAKYAGCTTVQSSTDLSFNASNGIVTTTSGGRIKHVQVVFATGCTQPRSLYVYGKNTAYSTFVKDGFPTGASVGTKIATATKTTVMNTGEVTVELPGVDEDFEDEYNYIALGADNSLRLTSVKITWSTGTTYYATHCETKTDVTITYDANGGTTTCGNGSHQVTWDYADGGAGAPALAESQTICSAATRDGYVLHDWTTSQDGSGTHYNPGQTVTSMDGDKTLYAQWDRVYTVTFNNQGTITSRTQASGGASVKVPNHTTPCTDDEHEPDEYTWTFAGWSTTPSLSNSLTPNLVLNATTGAYNADYTPSDDITLYAVYQKTVGTSPTFQNGKTGAYYISAVNGSSLNGTVGVTHYAGTKCENSSGGFNCNGTTNPSIPVYFTYHETGTYAGYYTIQASDGQYLGDGAWSNSPVYLAASAVSGGWDFVFYGTTRHFTHSAYFRSYASLEDPLILTPAPSATYFTTMTCASAFDMTFNMSSGVIDYGSGSSADYLNKPDGTVISTFPTATLDGWTFIGWTAGSQYNDLYDVSGYYSDQNSSNIDPISDPSVGGAIYGGIYGGTAYTMHSDIVMYPVFTKLEDNEPFDDINGGDYYIYYLADYTPISPYSQNDRYAGAHRVYATGFTGSVNCSGTNTQFVGTMNCENATVFTFTKLANGNWTIYDNTKHGYVTGKSDNGLQECTSDDTGWSFVQSGSKWILTYTSGKAFIANDLAHGATSAEFQNFDITSLTSQPTMYHYVYIGSCTERIFSSNPSTTPEIDLKGTAVVTASQNGAVRGTNVLTVSGHNLTPSTGTISITSNSGDIYFTTNTDDSFAEGKAAANQPKNTITVTANSSGIVNPTAIYVHYKPTGNTDGVTDVTVTATYSGAEDATTTVKARHVKENFAIAAKIANSWYALPANMSSSDVYTPTLIEVDESSNVAYGPSTVAYKLWPVKTTNGSGNRYAAVGDEVRFTGNSDNALWANNAASGTTTGIRNWAVVNSIDDGGSGSGEDLDERYEWVISTEDGDAYTINTNQSNNKRNLVIYRKNGQLVWATNGSYETNEIHLIPLTELQVIEIIPREWKADGLVFAIDADNLVATSGTCKIGTGDETAATYSRRSTGGYGLYEVTLPALASHYGKVLTLKMTINSVVTYAYVTIPIIVSGTTTTTTAETPFTTLGTASKDYDVVLLDGAKLTTNATASGAHAFQNFYVYPGATWVNNNGSTSFSYLELRGGIKGIDARDSHAQGVPHVLLNKAVSSTAGANLDMTVYTDHGYALSVPFDVDLSKVNFANSLKPGTGAQVNGTLASQFFIRKYDGEVRANNGRGGWVDITPEENKTIHAGEGYTLQGKRPKGQPFAVIRFPFTGVNSWADASGEVAKANIPIYAYAGGETTPDNDKGWNLIANPYMATISYDTDDELSWAASFKVGNLVKTEGANWDGKYQWKNATQAYVTIPNDSYTEFPQTRASKATFEPFKNFFIQTTSDGVVAFVRSDRHDMPRYLMAQTEQATPIYADINLAHGDQSAQAGLTIDADATTGYTFGEDYTIFESREALTYLKVYTIADGHYLVGNTLTPAETAELIPLEFYAPNINGEYVFSLDANSDIDRLEYVILYDAELGLNTNLLTNDYTVELEQTGLIENRFSIGLKVKEKDNSATGIGDVGGDSERPYKFLYRDKMYILRGGKIYDATGKQVREINK